MAASLEWLDELEQSFDDAYVSLDTSMNDLINKSRREELKRDALVDVVESSKEKLKKVSYLWSQLMEKAQNIFQSNTSTQSQLSELRSELDHSRTKDKEVDKLLSILESANLQVEHLKAISSKKTKQLVETKTDALKEELNVSRSLIHELISEHDDSSMSDLKTEETSAKDQSQNESMDLNESLNDICGNSNEQTKSNEPSNLNLGYEFKGTTQLIPCEPVSFANIQDPRLKAKSDSKQKSILSIRHFLCFIYKLK